MSNYRAVHEEDLIGEPIYVYIHDHGNALINDKFIYVRRFNPKGHFAGLASSTYQIENCPHNDKLLSTYNNYRDYNMCVDKRNCRKAVESNTVATKSMKIEIPLD